MSETIESTISGGKATLAKALTHLADELNKIRAGKASPTMLSSIKVDYYGTPTALQQVANVSAVDSRTLSIQPWEKPMLAAIERAIFEANIGLTPMNDGEFVRINIPPLTQERRVELVKQTKTLGENTKISLRNARQKMMDFVKKEVKNGYPEDAGKSKEGEIDGYIKQSSSKIDEMLAAKEVEIMKV
jgi:ribosome recycling factor